MSLMHMHVLPTCTDITSLFTKAKGCITLISKFMYSSLTCSVWNQIKTHSQAVYAMTCSNSMLWSWTPAPLFCYNDDYHPLTPPLELFLGGCGWEKDSRSICFKLPEHLYVRPMDNVHGSRRILPGPGCAPPGYIEMCAHGHCHWA